MVKHPQTQQGFVNIILLVVVTLVILYYLKIPLEYVLSLPTTEKIAMTIKELAQVVWHDFQLIGQFIRDILTGK